MSLCDGLISGRFRCWNRWPGACVTPWWHDFFLCATASALIFNKQFFPTDDPHVSQMLSYLTLALTFLIRPLGGIVFSHVGHRVGWQVTLAAAISITAVFFAPAIARKEAAADESAGIPPAHGRRQGTTTPGAWAARAPAQPGSVPSRWSRRCRWIGPAGWWSPP